MSFNKYRNSLPLKFFQQLYKDKIDIRRIKKMMIRRKK